MIIIRKICQVNATCMKILSDMLMTEHHKQQLIQCRRQLVNNMVPGKVIGQLYSLRVLDEEDVQTINDAGTMNATNETLLDILYRKPDSAFEHFLTALDKSRQGHVARLLRKRK